MDFNLERILDVVSAAVIGDRSLAHAVFVAVVLVILTRALAPRVFGREARDARKEEEEEEEEEIYPDPMKPMDMTRAQLAEYDGQDATKPILLAAKGVIFDVTRGRDFYGKGGPYNGFTGIDCSRALGKVSLEKENLCADVSDFAASQRDVLNDWFRKFEDKYPVVGKLTDGDYNGTF